MVNFREKFAKDNINIVLQYLQRVPKGLTAREENFFLQAERKVRSGEELECEEFNTLTLLSNEVKHLNKPRVAQIRPSQSSESENESTTWSDVASAGYQ